MPEQFRLSYFGQPFVLPDRATLDKIKGWMRVNERLLPGQPPVGGRTDGVYQYGMADDPIPPEVGLYDLYVPPGATKYALFRGLMHRDQVDILTGTGTGSVYRLSGIDQLWPQFLEMNTGQGEVVATMYLLPPVPLAGLDGAADLYLVTLVDARYFGAYQPVDTSAFFSGFPDWQTLLSQLLTSALGGVAAIVPPAIDAVYGIPEIDSEFYTWAGPANAMAEAALNSVGRVFTYDLSGVAGFSIPTWSEANTYAAAAMAAAAPYRAAGGALWSSVSDRKLVAAIPNNVVVYFPKWDDGYGFDCEVSAGLPDTNSEWTVRPRSDTSPPINFGITRTRADLGAPYTSLPLGLGSVALFTTYKARYDASGLTPTNTTEQTDLATQLAKDHFDRILSSGCETYNGVIPFDGRSALTVVYSYWPEPMTRVFRAPLGRWPTRFLHGDDQENLTRDTEFVYVTGALAADGYPGRVINGTASGGSLFKEVWVRTINSETLTVGLAYPAIRVPMSSFTGTPKPVYAVAYPSQSIAVGSTPISGGTSGGVLYSDGTLQSASKLKIVGNLPYIEAASNKWVGFGIGSY